VDAVLASVIAVAGTLLGSTITYLFPRSSTERAERFARGERLRQERLATYTAFVGAMTELRHGAISLRFTRHRDDPDGPDVTAAFTESNRLGAVANHACFRVQLIAEDPDLVALAAPRSSPLLLYAMPRTGWSSSSTRDAVRRCSKRSSPPPVTSFGDGPAVVFDCGKPEQGRGSLRELQRFEETMPRGEQR